MDLLNPETRKLLQAHQGKTAFDTWRNLLEVREQAETQEKQNLLADAEHYAFANSLVGEKPWMLPSMMLAPIGYYLAKHAGFMGGRSEPRLEQVGAGILGALQGFGRE